MIAVELLTIHVDGHDVKVELTEQTAQRVGEFAAAVHQVQRDLYDQFLTNGGTPERLAEMVEHGVASQGVCLSL